MLIILLAFGVITTQVLTYLLKSFMNFNMSIWLIFNTVVETLLIHKYFSCLVFSIQTLLIHNTSLRSAFVNQIHKISSISSSPWFQ